MEEHGRIVQIMRERSGVSRRTGETWKAQDFLLEIDGRYTRKVRFSLWGAEKLEKACLSVGEYVTVKAEVEAHETNGEWYNDIRVYDIEKYGRSVFRDNNLVQAAPSQQPAQQMPPQSTQQNFAQTANGQYVAPNYINPFNQPQQQTSYPGQAPTTPAF